MKKMNYSKYKIDLAYFNFNLTRNELRVKFVTGSENPLFYPSTAKRLRTKFANLNRKTITLD